MARRGASWLTSNHDAGVSHLGPMYLIKPGNDEQALRLLARFIDTIFLPEGHRDKRWCIEMFDHLIDEGNTSVRLIQASRYGMYTSFLFLFNLPF